VPVSRRPEFGTELLTSITHHELCAERIASAYVSGISTVTVPRAVQRTCLMVLFGSLRTQWCGDNKQPANRAQNSHGSMRSIIVLRSTGSAFVIPV
jgi:hypothetical protein